MYTFQSLLEVGDNDIERMGFVKSAIDQHKATELYQTAYIADQYNRHRNVTISQYQKLLYTVTGKVVPDNYSANYKLASGFFGRFLTQETQYLLGNGVSWNDASTKDRLGLDFDTRLQVAARAALWGGVSFGFFNLDHLEVFNVLEFAPLYDEENGSLSAGIRFWQIDDGKPLRATLYEMDGYTDYRWVKGEGSIMEPKRRYTQIIRTSEADGTQIFDGENYPTFPIIPLWGNPYHQSELVGIREQIDAYDLIKSGFCNTVDEASFIYWTISNAGGMSDIDLEQFVERLKTMHATLVEDNGAKAESHSIETPHESREALLDRLRRDLYEDYMALDTKELASGAATATEIKAAYEPLNNKADQLEYCLHDFLDGVLAVIGIDDEPTFTRSMLVNVQEEVQTVLQAASVLDSEYVTSKVLTILGDADKIDEVLKRKSAEDVERMDMIRQQEKDAVDEQADGEVINNG